MTVIYDKFVRVEYSEFSGEGRDFSEPGGLLVPAQASYSDGIVEHMFTEITGLPSTCIEQYAKDRLYDGNGILATAENGIVGKFIFVEYETPGQNPGNQFAFIQAQDSYAEGAVEALFTQLTGLPDTCISHYTVDELYDADGNIVTELAESWGTGHSG